MTWLTIVRARLGCGCGHHFKGPMDRFEPLRALHDEGVTGTLPAKQGRGVFLRKGQVLMVINTHGSQVVDTWAFNSTDLSEFMSMEHSRAYMLKMTRGVGDD